MGDPKFKLKSYKLGSYSSIQMKYYLNKKRFVYGTGLKILCDLWNVEEEQPKTDARIFRKYSKVDGNIRIKMRNLGKTLQNMSDDVIAYVSNCGLRNEPVSFIELRSLLDSKYKDVQPISKERLDRTKVFVYTEEFIKRIKSGEILTNRKTRYKKSTIKVYEEFKTQLEAFEKKTKPIFFDQIDRTFYDNYIQFFYKKNYKANSVGKQVKMLKAIMNCAYDEGIHNNLIYKSKYFKTIKVEVENIYLNEEELGKLLKFKDFANEIDEIYRDVFLVGCWTCQRFSDYSRINENMISKDKKYISLVQVKTSKKVKIPIKPELRIVLEKYDYNLPKTYEQKMNKSIKDICGSAGIDEIVTINEVISGKDTPRMVKKNEIVYSHTARRSGATNLYLAGIDPLKIISITGHAAIKDLERYIKVKDIEMVKKLSEHDYYTKLKIV